MRVGRRKSINEEVLSTPSSGDARLRLDPDPYGNWGIRLDGNLRGLVHRNSDSSWSGWVVGIGYLSVNRVTGKGDLSWDRAVGNGDLCGSCTVGMIVWSCQRSDRDRRKSRGLSERAGVGRKKATCTSNRELDQMDG